MKEKKKPQADSIANQEAKIEASEANAENKPVDAIHHWDTERDLSTLILDMTFNLAVELEHANKKIEELEMKMARSNGEPP